MGKALAVYDASVPGSNPGCAGEQNVSVEKSYCAAYEFIRVRSERLPDTSNSIFLSYLNGIYMGWERNLTTKIADENSPQIVCLRLHTKLH